MKFGNFIFIHFFWLIIGLFFFYLWSLRRRNSLWIKFAQPDLYKILTKSLDIKKRKLKVFLLFIVFTLLVLSLMRPQWGFKWQEVKRRGLDILIAIDTSKSMLSQDVKPNRLERSKLAVKDLLKKLSSDRVGLIAFAGTAFLQCPLTLDYNGFILALDSLDTNTIPQPGTSISAAIKEALKTYKGTDKKYKVLIIITDGEDHEGDLLSLSEKAKKEGLKIFCVGIGSKEGELIPVIDENGNKTFLKDRQGNFVKSRLDEAALQKIALNTSGSYVRATGADFGLDLIYEKKLSLIEKKEFDSKMRRRYEDRFQIFLFLITNQAIASSVHKDVKEGNKLYEKEKFDESLVNYNQALGKLPDSDIINFNIGSAWYKKGDYNKAIEFYSKVFTTEKSDLEAKANYNIGNCKYRQGKLKENTDLGKTIELYRQSLQYYKRSLELDDKDKEVKYNHEFVEKKLKVILDKIKDSKDQQKQNQQGTNENSSQDQQGQGQDNKNQDKQDKEEQEAQETKAKEEEQQAAKLEEADKEKEEEKNQSQAEAKEEEKEMDKEQAKILLEGAKEEEVTGKLNDTTMHQEREKVDKYW